MDSMDPGRSPHGERELKLKPCGEHRRQLRRSPHGERELKYRLLAHSTDVILVAPHTGSVS